jgi:hypothetical protein
VKNGKSGAETPPNYDDNQVNKPPFSTQINNGPTDLKWTGISVMSDRVALIGYDINKIFYAITFDISLNFYTNTLQLNFSSRVTIGTFPVIYDNYAYAIFCRDTFNTFPHVIISNQWVETTSFSVVSNAVANANPNGEDGYVNKNRLPSGAFDNIYKLYTLVGHMSFSGYSDNFNYIIASNYLANNYEDYTEYAYKYNRLGQVEGVSPLNAGYLYEYEGKITSYNQEPTVAATDDGKYINLYNLILSDWSHDGNTFNIGVGRVMYQKMFSGRSFCAIGGNYYTQNNLLRSVLSKIKYTDTQNNQKIIITHSNYISDGATPNTIYLINNVNVGGKGDVPFHTGEIIFSKTHVISCFRTRNPVGVYSYDIYYFKYNNDGNLHYVSPQKISIDTSPEIYFDVSVYNDILFYVHKNIIEIIKLV